ncbi:MAG: hypothetical protein ACI9EW_001282 [Cellvibrionaceae bacterium]|jgi:uncharacterized protein (TIGR02118 family)
MFKFVTIYRQVDDPDAINQFFSDIHLPLAEQLPGLVKTEVSWVKGKPGGQSRFYLMYELYFESEEMWRASLASEPGVGMIKALKPWGDQKILTWFFSETYEEDVVSE